jgi:hypothetical protein
VSLIYTRLHACSIYHAVVGCYVIGGLFISDVILAVYPSYDKKSNWMSQWSPGVDERYLLEGAPYIVIHVEKVTRDSGNIEDVVTILCAHGVCVTWAWMLREGY